MKWTTKQLYTIGSVILSLLFFSLVYFSASIYPNLSEFSFYLFLAEILRFDFSIPWLSSLLRASLLLVFFISLYDVVQSWKHRFFMMVLLLTVPVLSLYAMFLSVEFFFVFVSFFIVLSQGRFRSSDNITFYFVGLILCSLFLPVGLLVNVVLLAYFLLVWVAAMRKSLDESYIIFSSSFFILLATVTFHLDELRQLGVNAVTGNVPSLIESTFFSVLTIVDIAQWMGFPLLFLGLVGIYDSLWVSLKKEGLLWLSGLLTIFFFYTLNIISTQYVVALVLSPLLLFSYVGIKTLEESFHTYIYSVKTGFVVLGVVIFSFSVLTAILTASTFTNDDVLLETEKEAFEHIGNTLPQDSITFISPVYADAFSYYANRDVAVSSRYTEYTFVNQRYEDLLFLERQRFLTNIVGVLNRYGVSHIVLSKSSDLIESIEGEDCFPLLDEVSSFKIFEVGCTLS